jgi:YD repeat-containing protein
MSSFNHYPQPVFLRTYLANGYACRETHLSDFTKDGPVKKIGTAPNGEDELTRLVYDAAGRLAAEIHSAGHKESVS